MAKMEETVQESAEDSATALAFAKKAKKTEKAMTQKFRYYIEEKIPDEGRDLEGKNEEVPKFQCTRCDTNFTRKDNLERHKKSRW